MRVYHLLSTQFAINNIALSRIKISRFNDLNDPFELLAMNLKEKELRNAVKITRDRFNENSGIVCFSRNWENPVLWSHYAEKHTGMALGFDVFDEDCSEVNYSPDRIQLQYLENEKLKKIDQTNSKKVVTTKYEHWKYEDEIRLFLGLDKSTSEGGLYFLPFSEKLILREVILGHSCPIPIKQVKDLIKKLHPQAQVIKARLAFQSFRVVADQRSINKTKN